MTSLQHHHHPRTMEATAVERSSVNMHGLSSVAVGDTSSTSTAEVPATSNAPPPDSEIQRLSHDTIRRISAEQAISDLSSIVKELVDNALDAEATTIKSKLVLSGSTCNCSRVTTICVHPSHDICIPPSTFLLLDSPFVPTRPSYHRSL